MHTTELRQVEYLFIMLKVCNVAAAQPPNYYPA